MLGTTPSTPYTPLALTLRLPPQVCRVEHVGQIWRSERVVKHVGWRARFIFWPDFHLSGLMHFAHAVLSDACCSLMTRPRFEPWARVKPGMAPNLPLRLALDQLFNQRSTAAAAPTHVAAATSGWHAARAAATLARSALAAATAATADLVATCAAVQSGVAACAGARGAATHATTASALTLYLLHRSMLPAHGRIVH